MSSVNGLSGPAKKPDTASPWRRYAWPWYRRLIRATSLPIVIGPFTSELGFEILYWIPWLARWKKEDGIESSRLVVVGRGGSAAWYGAELTADIYDLRHPQAIRIENRRQFAATGSLKQWLVTPYERRIAVEAASRLDIERFHLLHPAWMYHEWGPTWDGLSGWMDAYKDVPFMAPMSGVTPIKLSEPYIAVKWYDRSTFPPTGDIQDFTEAALRALLARTAVLLLDSPLILDDHAAFKCRIEHPRLVRLSRIAPLEPATNLQLQANAIAGAEAFVGTWGGTAQLAAVLGKPVLAFYDVWRGALLEHLTLCQRIAMLMGRPFFVLSVRNLAVLDALLPRVAVRQPAIGSSAGFTTAPPR